MDYFVDTGILLRLFHRRDPLHTQVEDAVLVLRARGDMCFTAAQNVAEFWNASTRPRTARAGYGASIQGTEQRVELIEQDFAILTESAETYAEWKRLVVDHRVSGARVHDARLVAIMRVSSIAHIFTLNPRDFARFPGITALTPQQILQSPPP